MASTQAIAELRALSIDRLNSGFGRLAAMTGVEAPVIVVQKRERDPQYQQAKLLETLANWMDAHIEALAPSSQGEDLSEVTDDATIEESIESEAPRKGRKRQ